MTFLSVCSFFLLLTTSSFAGAPPLSQEELEQQMEEEIDQAIEQNKVVFVELTNNSGTEFKTNDPLGRGILDKKTKKTIHLYCQQRDTQSPDSISASCLQAQYGISTIGHLQKDAFGNSSFYSGVKPIGPVMNISQGEKTKEIIKQLKTGGRWRYPKLNFDKTVNTWDKLGEMMGWSFVVGYFGGIGSAMFINPTTGWIVAGTATVVLASPTILDLILNAAKISTVPFILMERATIDLLTLNRPQKIAAAMTAHPRNWMFRPLKLSHSTFEIVHQSLLRTSL